MVPGTIDERVPFINCPWHHLFLNVEAHALRERQGARVVDGVGGAAHVGLPGVAAGLASTASLLLAAEGAADFRAAGADVHVGDAAVAAGSAHEPLGLLQLAREDARGESLG